MLHLPTQKTNTGLTWAPACRAIASAANALPAGKRNKTVVQVIKRGYNTVTISLTVNKRGFISAAIYGYGNAVTLTRLFEIGQACPKVLSNACRMVAKLSEK